MVLLCAALGVIKQLDSASQNTICRYHVLVQLELLNLIIRDCILEKWRKIWRGVEIAQVKLERPSAIIWTRLRPHSVSANAVVERVCWSIALDRSCLSPKHALIVALERGVISIDVNTSL